MKENDIFESLLELPKLKVDLVEKMTGRINIFCHQNSSEGLCPQCLKPTSKLYKYSKREVRDLNILNKETWLHLRVKHYECTDCNRYFTEDFDFVEPNKSYTKRQAKWIFLFCAKQPFSEAGSILNMCSKTVERIYYLEGEKLLNQKAKYAAVKRLGIDEISHTKGSGNYCLVLTDLDKNIQLDILPDRKKATLISHFQSLGVNFCIQIEEVSCDIWRPYIDAVKQCLPNATITLDYFHVIKALNEALDRRRKKLRKDFPEEVVFKNIKWSLFKQKPTSTQEEDLKMASKKDAILEKLLIQRNKFHQLFATAPDAKWLNEKLTIWINEAENLAIPILDKFLKTLIKWQQLIANYAENRLTNAATEGLNNIIRYFKRISFGLPNFKNMRLRVLLNYV